MRTFKPQTGLQEMKARLSTLWVFVMVNILAADIFSFMLQAGAQKAQVHVSQEMMLAFAVVIEIPIAMIILSRVLGHRANRLANIAASVITIAFVVAGGSLDLHYLFFATAEVAAMVYMIWAAWTWKGPKPETVVTTYERRAMR